jgi:hypothetical protein
MKLFFHNQLLSRLFESNIADNLSKPVGVGAVYQPWIPTDERSLLLTRIATVNASLCAPMRG